MKASALLPSSCPVVTPQPAIKTNDHRRLRRFFRALLAGLTLLVATGAAPSRSQAQSLLDCSCLATQAVLFTSACTSTIPDLCLVATNCYTPTPGFAPGFTCTQNPPPGTPVNTMTVITFTLTETSSGSNVTCQVTNYVGVFTNRFTLICPPDLTVPCNSTNWSFPAPTWTNTCCPASNILISLVSVVTNWPTITATWQGIECNGLVEFCTQSITFADPNGLPCDCLEIICPPDQIIQTCLPPFPVPGAGTNVFYPLPLITNHCIGTITNIVVSPPSGSFFPVGTNTVTAIVQDDLGNAATCVFNVIVLGDTTPPVVTCASNQVVQCGTPWAPIPPTAVDNCCSNLFIMIAGAVTNTVSPCLETIEFHWHVMDCHGNAADCTNIVTVVDTLPPVINCNSNQFYSCGIIPGTTIGWTPVPPIATDNCCPSPTVTLVNAVTNASLCTEVITLTWQATDCCTNSAFCTEVVTLTDTNAPTINCPPQRIVECGAVLTFDPPTASDACCGTNVTVTLLNAITNIQTTCFSSYTLIWQATDCCTNSALCSQSVLVVDTTPPVVTCAPDKHVECGTPWTFDPPTAVDACCGTNVTITVLNTATNALNLCQTVLIRTWDVADCCGNSVTCTQSVSILDTTPPVINCVSNQLVQCGTAWTFTPPTAVDVCCGSAVQVFLLGVSTNIAGPCLETYTALWEARDCCGNKSICTTTITVADTLPPVINCNSNQFYSCANAAGIPGGWTLVPPTATDNCCPNPTVTLINAVTNASACTEVITLTWQATDCCTNSAFCTEVITITDTNAPTINCAQVRLEECGTTWSFTPPTASDPCCGTNVTVTLLNAVTNVQSTCFSSYTLLWQATDCCTNSTTCIENIIVQDTTPPVVTCAADKHVECGTAWTFDPPTAVDACCGTNVTITVLSTVTNVPSFCPSIVTRTWDVSDCCGNGVTCSQTVFIQDTTPPVITCTNLTIQCGTPWTFTPPAVFDACCGSAVQVALVNVSTNIVGPCLEIYTAVWLATDCCGNKMDCIQTITVVDTLPPVIQCNTNQTFQCGGTAGTPGWTPTPPVAVDNCCTNVTVTLLNSVTNLIGCTNVITLTWEATDCCSNSAVCTEIVTIVDTTPPVIQCNPQRVEECGTTLAFTPPPAFDFCCGTNVTVTLVNTITNVQGPCFSSYTLVWTATDCCGNVSPPCFESVIVVDTTPPVVVCAPDKTEQCGTPWTFDLPTATDLCCGTNFTITVLSTVTNTPGFCPLIVTRTWDVSDCCGNSVTCSQTVIVEDSTPPVINCNSNQVVQCGTQWVLTPPTATDNCCPASNVSIVLLGMVTNTVGPCQETYTALWEATDCCGNKSTCTEVITVVDTLPPVIQCNTNQTFQCGGTAGTPGWTPTPPVAVDNCCTNVTVTLLNSVTNLIGCTNVITLTWEAADCCSNSAVCTEIVTIVDTTPPVIQCNPQRVEECGTTLAFTPPPAFDACCGTNVTVTLAFAITNTQSTCFSSYTLGWLAVDCCGNTASCLEQVFVVDTTPPVVVCAPGKTEQCGTPWSFDPPTGFDDCCGTNITITVLNTITNSIGQCPLIVTRLWNVTDCCGNGVSCSQTVIVEDSTPPIITCASNQVVQCGNQWSFLPPTATDNCCPASNISIVLLGVVTNTIGPCQETYTVLWEATDCCGNKSTCTSLVTVVDTLPPVVQCNTNQTYQCGGTPPWTPTPPVATDNCCTNVTVTLLSAVTNTAPCSEVITLTWEATDCCSNSTVCTEVVTLVDTTPPIITCAPWKIVECGTPWTFDDPTAFDACCGTNVTLTVVTTTTNLFSSCIKLYQRIWLATDCCTNTASCGQFVIEWDSTPPVLNCGPNQTVPCGTAWTFGPPPTALDACCGTNVTVTLASTTVSQPSPCTTVHTQTWQGVDCCGNVATCSRSVTEVDNLLPPVITCASNQVVQCGSPWTFTPPTATDNCCPASGITLSILSTTTNSIAPCQDLITVVWQAMDCCGNTSTCTTSVTVIDTLPPVINCQSNVIVQCGTFTTLPVPTVTDNCCPNPTLTLLNAVTNQSSQCLTVITRTWQATDCCTNTVICTDTVSIVDTTPPVLSCAPNKTLPCNANWSFDPPTVVDACCGTNVTVSVLFTTPLFGTQCSQSTTRVWVATDCCGNSVTCSQTVTLVDNIPPVATCAPNKTVQCGSNWTFDPPTAIDACCGTNVTITIQSTAVGFGSPCTGHIRTWLITDCCGNSTTCSQSVNVVDTIPPTIVCAPNFTVNAGNPWTFTQPTAFDACCTPTILVLNTTTNVVGCNTTYTRYWRAVDCCGNLSPICSQSVTVLGTLGPPNDPCPNPISLVLNAPYICGSNICATATPPGILSPIPCGLSVNSPDVWYTVTAQCTGPLTVDTCAPCPGYPVFDTVLSAYTGNCNGPLIQVPATWPLTSCNDDWCGLRSRIQFPAIAGQTYRIRVAGYNSAVGWFAIRATQPIIPPVNDLCVNAIPVNAGNPAACGTTICATPTLPGTLIPTPCGSSVSSPDVWYRFTPQCSGPVTINTCGTCPPAGTFDTVLSVYTGNCNGPLNQVVCNDDAGPNGPCPSTFQSFVSFNATAGVTYYIRVAGWAGASGNFRLNINYGLTPPANDLCFNATPVTAGTHVWNNCGANTDGPPAACQPTPDVWFNYTPTCSGLVMLNTCLSTIDTVMSVYSGPCGGLSLIACNDNATAGSCNGSPQSFLTFNAIAGTTYRIRVGGAGGAQGGGVLNIVGPNPPANTCGTGPLSWRNFLVTGPGNGIPWAWSVSSPCCANLQNLNTSGVFGSATAVATAFRNSINAVCPGTATSFGPFLNIATRCGPTAPVILQVGPAGTAPQNLCVVGGSALPTSGPCSFNPEIVEVILTGRDDNQNGIDDYIDIALGTSQDVNGNLIPDEVEDCFGPQFLAKPDSEALELGADVTLSVTVSGTPPFHYQWLRDGEPLPGATNSTLTINPVTEADLGAYSVIVSNDCGVLEGSGADLFVVPPTLPVIYDAQLTDGWFYFMVETKLGFEYLIEYKDDLNDTGWQPLMTVPGIGAPQLIFDSEPPPNHRFYRVQQLPGSPAL